VCSIELIDLNSSVAAQKAVGNMLIRGATAFQNLGVKFRDRGHCTEGEVHCVLSAGWREGCRLS
jgi:hypothetical protein